MYIFSLLVFFFASTGKNATRKIFTVLPAKPLNEVYTFANKSIEKRICKGDQKSQHGRLKTWEEYLYLVLKVVDVTRRDYA